MIIQRVGVLSVARITGIVSAAIGLIAAVVTLLALYVLGIVDIHDYPGLAWMARFGAAGLIMLPVFYALMGFIAGAVHAWIYNLAARLVGGIEIETR